MKILSLISFLILISFYSKGQAKKGHIHLLVTYSLSCRYNIELDSMEGKRCSGTLKLYTEEYDDTTQKFTGRKYQDSALIESTAVRKIINTYQTMNISAIPDWNGGLDGTDYDVEFAKDGNVIRRTYWSPEAYKGDDKKTVKRFLDTVKRAIQAQGKVFFSHMPFECYTTPGDGNVTCRILSDDQKRKIKAERDAYINSHPPK